MNRYPTKSVKTIIPQDSWTSMKHSIYYLKVFGCVRDAHIPDELRKKLYNNGNKCIFVFYLVETKSYKLYGPVIQKVMIIRDVQFMENESWDKSIEKKVKIVNHVTHDDITEEVDKTPHASQSVTVLSTLETIQHVTT